MQYKLFGWTPNAFNDYNINCGIDMDDPIYEDERNLPFFKDVENDEVNLLDNATLIAESDDEDEIKDKKKKYVNTKYRTIQIWDDEEYMFIL